MSCVWAQQSVLLAERSRMQKGFGIVGRLNRRPLWSSRWTCRGRLESCDRSPTRRLVANAKEVAACLPRLLLTCSILLCGGRCTDRHPSHSLQRWSLAVEYIFVCKVALLHSPKPAALRPSILRPMRGIEIKRGDGGVDGGGNTASMRCWRHALCGEGEGRRGRRMRGSGHWVARVFVEG